jgi:hypothetical protein
MKHRNRGEWRLGSVVVLVALAGCAKTAVSAAAPGVPETRSASDNAVFVETSLRNVIVAARTATSDSAEYASLTPDSLAEIYDGVCYESGRDQAGICSDGSLLVQVAFAPHAIGAAAMTTGNQCLWIRDNSGEETRYGAGMPCTGKAALEATAQEFPKAGE